MTSTITHKAEPPEEMTIRFRAMPASPHEFSIYLRPLPASPWITSDPAFGTSTVTLPKPATVIGVHLNGVPLRHRDVDALTITVSPRIPLQGDRLELRCLGDSLEPPEALQALQRVSHAHPIGRDFYGLQAPSKRLQGAAP